MNNYVTRIHLKPGNCDHNDLEELVNLCLHTNEQFLAIGWSNLCADKNCEIKDYDAFYNKATYGVKTNPVLNVFKKAEKNDLFWTRDRQGVYWICRATGTAEPKIPQSDEETALFKKLDIGAFIPVKAYPVGLEVPGQIKASFNRPLGGTSHKIYEPNIFEYSKKVYNLSSGTETYEVSEIPSDILDNLPDFDLEELVISYLQLKENYYVLSNSIANKSTTIKIECELIHRNKTGLKKAVVQVKGPKADTLNALDYKPYDDDGYIVYLYAPRIINQDKLKNCIIITTDDLRNFYSEYKSILPKSITLWEKL